MDDQLIMTEPTDADLARAWAAGDERAYDAIVARFAPLVFSRCRRALGAADADDATQAVFLVLATRRAQAAASPVLAAWLMTVAANVVRNAWRDRQRRRNAETSVPPPTPPAAEDPAMHDIQVHLDACLAELPAKEREAVLLHHLAGRTLAEVAVQTRSGVSTVKERLSRGLERLRTRLAARGVALGSVALLAILASEAQAAVPAEVLVHLRDLNPAVRGTGPTAVPSARVVRWSRQRSSTMTRIAIAAAGLLLIGGAAAQFLSSAEAGSAPPAQPPVPAPPAQAARNPLLDIDPEHARTWIVLRANDGVRTVKRLRAQPEMALLPPWLNQSLDALASLREAVLVADKDSVMNASWRTWLYQQRQRKATGAKPEPRGEDARIVEDIPFFSGWAICSDEQSPLLVNLRSALNGPPMPASIQSTKDGWNWASRTGNTRISLTGGRVLVSAPESSAAVPASLPTSSLVPAADVEFHLYLDPGRKGSKLLCAATGSVHVEADGLRVTASETHWNDAPCLTATLDRQHFERVPAAAILAGAAAIHPGAHEDHKRFRVVFAGMPLSVEPQDRDTPDSPTTRGYKALHVLLARTNGVLLAWIEPGLPVPSLTIEADMAQADADAVLTAAGLVVAADGTATMTIGPMNFTLGWRAGQLIITSNPGGLDAIDRNGGFINHPEIRRGLAVLPAGTLNACVLLRPLATLDMAMPFGAMFGPAVQKPLMDYRAATDKAHSYGVFCVSNDGSSTRIDAGGVLAMLGCGFLALQASDPAALLQLAN